MQRASESFSAASDKTNRTKMKDPEVTPMHDRPERGYGPPRRAFGTQSAG